MDEIRIQHTARMTLWDAEQRVATRDAELARLRKEMAENISVRDQLVAAVKKIRELEDRLRGTK